MAPEAERIAYREQAIERERHRLDADPDELGLVLAAAIDNVDVRVGQLAMRADFLDIAVFHGWHRISPVHPRHR
ncbi:hypothetical protein [Dongia deserti]|uniref:hypothetical protein n=1 Tax=Dongia deserti TaxID=2268030 RepID=UPI000E64F5CD|nr:hypothetical protein [Dongia deserti]